MKNIFLVTLLCCFINISFAQDIVTISGRVLDKTTKEPLPYASVSLMYNSENEIVGGAISDNEGRFEISGELSGEYTVKTTFVGYQTDSITVLVGELNTIFDLGNISLETKSKQLNEVTIKAQKSIISSNLDKKTYSINDNLAQSGGSVLDAMKAMPGVTVDQEGKVIIRGSDKVAVLIDGKQSSLTGFGNQKSLDNIPVANIEQIEIINNPSAKYDASGMAGIINIIYKKEKETGFNGDIGFTYGLGVLTKAKEDLPTELGSYSKTPKYIPSLNLNYKTNKINFFLQSEILFQEKLPNNEFTTRYYENNSIIASQVAENRKQIHYIFKGGADWNINEYNILSISGIYDYESHVDTSQVPYIETNTGNRYRYWAWNEEEVTGYMNYAANYKYKFPQTGHELKLGGQYTKGWEDESYFLNDSSEVRESGDTTHILATEHTTNITFDYVKPLRNGRLESGIKTQWRRIPVEYTIGRGESSIIYPGIGDWSEWGENIYAAYINYVYEKPKFDIEAGLRAEQTDVFYNISPENIYYQENDSYSYFELFPNVRLSYKLNEQNKFSIFYNRRIDRPGEPELRIFPKYDDPELLKVGNPYLRPQFTQTFELAYRLKWETGSFFLSGFHRMIENPYMRIYSIDTTSTEYNIVNKIYQNTGSATNTGVELIFSQQITKFWKLSGSFNLYKNIIEAYQGTLLFPYERSFNIEKTEDKTWDCKLSNQFELACDIQIQLTAVYYAAKNIPQGKQLERSSIDIGIRKKILKNKLELNFSFSDIFNRFGIRQQIQDENFSAEYENLYETQVVRLGIKYKF